MNNREIRAFFAINLPKNHVDRIAKLLSTLKKLWGQQEIRWVKPENLHITLQFLEKIRLEHTLKLTTQVRQAMLNLKPFHINLGKLELFPGSGHPKVISLEVTPEENLTQLVSSIGKEILLAGYPVETRPFKGHLTLGRIKSHKIFSLEDIEPLSLEKFLVKEVVLFQSEPGKGGSKYTAIDVIEL